MQIKRAIHTFFIKNSQGFQINNLTIPCEFKFPARSIKQQICFLLSNDEICIDLIYYKCEEVNIFKLINSNLISKDYLNEMSIEFSFNITNHPLVDSFLIGVIPNLPSGYGKTCYGVIKKVKDSFFFMIFAKRGTTDFEDDIIYVHGIWEVELFEEFKIKLFGTKNKPL